MIKHSPPFTLPIFFLKAESRSRENLFLSGFHLSSLSFTRMKTKIINMAAIGAEEIRSKTRADVSCSSVLRTKDKIPCKKKKKVT